MKRNFRGFTLIELLVVIAIIGLISSIVLVNMDLPEQKQKTRIAKSLEFSSSIQNALGSEAVGIWNFDDCAATDSSGNGNNGAINGASCVNDTPQKVVGSGQGKNALTFNGTSDYVQIPSSKIGTGNQLSIGVWVLPYDQIAGSYTYHKDIVRSNCYGGGSWGISTDQNFNSNSQISVLIGWITNAATWWSPTNVSKNQWNHLVLVMDRSTGKATFYKNGQLVDSTIQPVGSKPLTTGLRIGDDCAGPFRGIVDEVRIYEQALSVGQIQKHYAEGLENHKDFAVK
jgi:prepilin-type N-terminal cleavage/methylation domain-containing protein